MYGTSGPMFAYFPLTVIAGPPDPCAGRFTRHHPRITLLCYNFRVSPLARWRSAAVWTSV